MKPGRAQVARPGLLLPFWISKFTEGDAMEVNEIRYPALDAPDRLTGDESIALGDDLLSDVRGF